MPTLQDPSEDHNLTSECQGVPETWALYLGVTFTGTVSVSGAVLNLLALGVFIQQARERPCLRLVDFTSDTILMVNLVLVDLLYCLVAMPSLLATYLLPVEYHDLRRVEEEEEEEAAPPFCEVTGLLRYIMNSAEINTISLISLERCHGILNRSRSHLLSSGQAIGCCVFVWILSTILQLAILPSLKFGFNACMYKCDFLAMGWARVLVFLAEGVGPVVILLVAYWLVICHVLRHNFYGLPVTCSVQEQRKVAKRTRRAVCCLVRYMGVYSLTILPVCLYNVLDTRGMYKELGILIYCPYWSLFIVNTWIHLADDKDYRLALVELLGKVFGQRKWVRRRRRRRRRRKHLTSTQVSPSCLVAHLRSSSLVSLMPSEGYAPSTSSSSTSSSSSSNSSTFSPSLPPSVLPRRLLPSPSFPSSSPSSSSSSSPPAVFAPEASKCSRAFVACSLPALAAGLVGGGGEGGEGGVAEQGRCRARRQQLLQINVANFFPKLGLPPVASFTKSTATV
ncbi:uncharacterized protein [Penaeus vannamei]|uniref:uncharacterized protein n=1 Tax=Penaeus vannamei TaxID=6689 RepID=UPI00387F822D